MFEFVDKVAERCMINIKAMNQKEFIAAYCSYLIVNRDDHYRALLEELLFELEHRRMVALDPNVMMLLMSSHVHAQLLNTGVNYTHFFELSIKWLGKNT